MTERHVVLPLVVLLMVGGFFHLAGWPASGGPGSAHAMAIGSWPDPLPPVAAAPPKHQEAARGGRGGGVAARADDPSGEFTPAPEDDPLRNPSPPAPRPDPGRVSVSESENDLREVFEAESWRTEPAAACRREAVTRIWDRLDRAVRAGAQIPPISLEVRCPSYRIVIERYDGLYRLVQRDLERRIVYRKERKLG